jgi:hypothetical protein
MMNKGLGYVLGAIMVIAGLLFTGSCTIDLIDHIMPTERAWMGYVSLFFLDGGIIIWTIFFLEVAEGYLQRGLSILLVIIDVVGVVVATIFDIELSAALKGIGTKPSQNTIDTTILICSAIIISNIVAMIAFHIVNPERRRRSAEKEAQAAVEDAVVKQIHRNAPQLAARAAPVVAQEWLNRLESQLYSGVSTPPPPIPQISYTLPPVSPPPPLSVATAQVLPAPPTSERGGNIVRFNLKSLFNQQNQSRAAATPANQEIMQGSESAADSSGDTINPNGLSRGNNNHQ